MKKRTEKWVKQQVVKVLKDVECKANGNKPTVLQSKNLIAIKKSGGEAFIIDEHSIELLEVFIKSSHIKKGKRTIDET